MAIVDNDIRSSCLIVDNVDTFQVVAIDFLPVDWTPPETMPEHSKPDERQRYALGKEYLADDGRDIGECVSYTSNNNILE